jgi:hypothetical protein
MAVLAFVVLIPPLVERFMVSAGLTLRRNLWVILIGHGVYDAAHAIHLSGFFSEIGCDNAQCVFYLTAIAGKAWVVAVALEDVDRALRARW